MNAKLIDVIAFAAILLIIVAITFGMIWVRKVRKAPDDEAIRELYDQYVADTEALTQAYLLQEPPDHEWLARIREPGKVPHPPQARQRPLVKARQAPKPPSSPEHRPSGERPELHGKIPGELLLIAACVVVVAFLAHYFSSSGDVRWLAPTFMAAIAALTAYIRDSTGEPDEWGVQGGSPPKEEHPWRIGKRRHSATITPGHADAHPDDQDRGGPMTSLGD